MDKKTAILKELYNSSKKYIGFVVGMILPIEAGMTIFSFVNPSFYNENVIYHRIMYVIIMTVAVSYLLILMLIKRDPDHRIRYLNIINPIMLAVFLCWSVFATLFESMTSGKVDVMVYIICSLALPVIFITPPKVFMAINIVTDLAMLAIYARYFETAGALINFVIFLFFQVVIERSILILRYKMATRIIEEKEYAEKDVMTGFYNRRIYEFDMDKLEDDGNGKEWIYISLDINGLKEINDNHGHAAGDKLIKGAAECMEKSFGNESRLYRIGGDEFVALLFKDKEEMMKDFEILEAETAKWSRENGMSLTISHGFIKVRSYDGYSVRDVIKAADKLMYEAKDRYYRENGIERRRA
ncbi:MAG: GGDEF domain-containing protein [Lachnospiraceae bacterium]|nr:GGDEF domain-containing protein [Lachnospiraceae bacterium]